MRNWMKGKVGDLLQGLESGVSVNGHDRAPMPDERSVLKVSSVTYGIFNSDSAKPIKEKDASRAKCNPRKGQIIISRSNTPELVGASTLVDKDYPCRYLSDKLWQTVPRPNIQLCTKWLAFVLSSPEVRYKLSQLATGSSSSMKNITKDELLSLPILIPPYSEQRIISDTLEKWDTAIEKTEALINAKERQFGWLKSKLIGEQASYISKLGDHFGKNIIIEKGKPLIKANIAENGSIPVIAGGKSSPYSHDQLTHSDPCITISASGAYAGYVWYHDYPIWASDCNVVYSTEHSTEYLYFALKLKQSRIYAFQSGGGQPHVYARDLKNISIPLPPLEEQKRIAHTLNTAQQEINLLKKLADQYRTQKRGLIQKLLSGEN